MADQEAKGMGTGPADDSKKSDIAAVAAGTPTGVPAASIPVRTKTSEENNALGNDIAKILQGVKLPERRDVSAQQKPIENKAAAFDTTLGAVSSPTPPATPTPPPGKIGDVPGMVTPQSTKESLGIIVPVHTLKDDLQHVVKDQKISVVRAVSLEQDRRGREKSDRFDTPGPQSTRRTGRILFIILMLLILGGAALFGVYIVMQSQSAPPPSVQTSSILFAESSVSFPLSNASPTDIKSTLASSIASLQGALGSITAVIPTIAVQNADGTTTTRPATFAEFMKAIGANPPDELLRAIGDQFFFGIHVVDTNAPLFVIPVTSYDHAFAGMLAWEPTMDGDLAPIFPALPATATDANGLPITRAFTDDVMRNYDVRELKDNAGNVKLYYSFPSQNILVIAESPYSFAEILSRLQAARQL